MLTRMFNEYTPLLQLQNEMNRLFGSFAEEMPEVRPYGVRYPAFNAWEDGENCYIEAELPGLTLGETEVLVAGDQVTITGERKLEEPKEASWHRRERSQGRFSRTLTIPWQINAEKVEATLHDGVLTVRLPKAESAKPKKVKVLTA